MTCSSTDDGETWTDPVVIAHKRNRPGKASDRWLAYPYVFEYKPGELWITTMQGGLRVEIQESEFVAE